MIRQRMKIQFYKFLINLLLLPSVLPTFNVTKLNKQTAFAEPSFDFLVWPSKAE